MKNDSFLSIPMDLPGENASCNGNDDGENEFTNGSSDNQGDADEAKQSGNVNSSPSQWPLRHNNHNESLERHNSYPCNGFRQAKKPRYTYTGRISRIPSRYLDTDSDSGDGSVRKDGLNRLKVKRSRRRRKLPSSTGKLLANGFKEDALLLSVADFEVDAIAENLDEQECLASVEYPDVFEDTSPISKYKISHIDHERQDKHNSRPNTSLGNELMCSESFQGDVISGEAIIVADSRSRAKQTAEHSFTSSGCCVDISCKNNSRPRFESLMESSEETAKGTHDVNEQKLENCPTRLANTTCKRENLHEASSGDDSSTRRTVVSPKQILKDCKVSCAIHNDINTASSVERENCKNCKEYGVNSSFVWTENIQNSEDNEFELSGKTTDDIGSKLLKKKRLVKSTKRPSTNYSDSGALPIEVEGLGCLKDLKMRKAFAKKLKQKQLRRNEKTDQNDGLERSRKNGVVCNDKVNVEKVEKRMKSKMNKKVNKVRKMKDADVTKPTQQSEELDRVLGMRQNPSGIYEFLVEWRNGTSCWVSSDDIVMDKHNYYLREYLAESGQDVSVVKRVPFQAYCCDSLSLTECDPGLKSNKALRKLLCVETSVPKTVCKPVAETARQKDDVRVCVEEEYCYITLTRETCKRKNTCLKIMMDLITALEDAATSDCQAVVLRGLQSDVLCGLKLADMAKTGVEKENGILSQTRYLVQTLRDYPKLLIALISKSAEGIGAVFLSLFDMICDEETWDNKQILESCEKESKDAKNVYTLPRVTGHSLLSEEILMGKHTENAELCNPISSGHDAFIDDASLVKNTLMEIEATLRALEKQASLLRVNGEISEMFPAAEPRFASFSDIKHEVSSELETTSSVDKVEKEPTACDKSLSESTSGDRLSADVTNEDGNTDENPITSQVASESSSGVGFPKDCSHISTEQQSSTDHSTNDQLAISSIPMDCTETEQVNTEQRTFDDAINVESTTKQSNSDVAGDCEMTDHTLRTEQCISDKTAADQHAGAENETNGNITNCVTTKSDQSTKGNVVVEQSIIDREFKVDEVLDTTNGDQNRTDCTDTADTMDTSTVGVCVESLAGTGILKSTHSDLGPEHIANHYATVNSSDSCETRLHHVDPVKSECNLTKTSSSTESTITECTTANDTSLTPNSTDGISGDVVMESVDNTDGTDNGARSDCSETVINECREDRKRDLQTNVNEVVDQPVKMDRNCPENTENTSITAEHDTAKLLVIEDNTTDKNDISPDKRNVSGDITITINQTMQDSNDETLKQDVHGVTDGDKIDRDFVSTRKTENELNVNNNTSDDKNLKDEGFNSTISERITNCTEKLPEIKTNEGIKEFPTVDSNTLNNKNEQISTNDIDMDNTMDCTPTANNEMDEHIEIVGYEVADSIVDDTAEHVRSNGSEILPSVSSTADAVDRYVKKLEAQIEAERSQAQQYIEEISRLWECPFLCKDK